MSGPDWIKTSDLQWLHQFREHFPVYSAPTPQFGETFIDILQVFTILYTHKLQRVVSIHRPPGHFTRRASTAPRRS